jgi:branched-subunit amino acid aminotransferase/4-amino-4-deoxychorismate lyase
LNIELHSWIPAFAGMTDIIMSKTFYFNGKFVSEKEAVVPVTTHALHYGTGNYEGIRAYYSEEGKCLYAFRVEDHFKRMVESTKIMHIKLPGTSEKLTEITKELLKKNFSETDVYIRPLAYKSDPAIGNFNLDKLAAAPSLSFVNPAIRLFNFGSKINPIFSPA